MQIKILLPFIGNVTGRGSVRFLPDEIADVPDGDADNFVRGKYAEYVAAVSDVPAVKIQNKPKTLSHKSVKK